ncbi:MAG: hypothetical protein JO354_11140 [Verrucomicrobia bacterium]|nr:hypothetical protein [Verrucomicrobiota bacterium]
MNRFLLVALPLCLVCAACGSDVLEDTIEKDVPLPPTGTLSLQAIDGSVEIYGAETNEIQIVATRRAFSPERLNSMRVEVRRAGDAVTIATVGPSKPRWALTDHSGTIDYVINVPQRARLASVTVPNGELIIHGMRGAAIHASLGNGRLTAHNCFCDQQLRVQKGGLDLYFDWVEQQPIKIDAAVVNGNVRAIIPGDASFELHAASAHGKVTSDFSEMAQRKRGGLREINEVIGPAALSRVTLRASDGNIQISQLNW